MRLSKDEVDLLKKELYKLSKNAKLYLFGSRVDDSKRGGDIDLLIVSNELTKKDLRTLRVEFFKLFGEQKLDIVLDDGSFKDPFVKLIYKKAVLL
jgi:predicted nucleotidyltransferase